MGDQPGPLSFGLPLNGGEVPGDGPKDDKQERTYSYGQSTGPGFWFVDHEGHVVLIPDGSDKTATIPTDVQDRPVASFRLGLRPSSELGMSSPGSSTVYPLIDVIEEQAEAL
jgi:hypothetical protein